MPRFEVDFYEKENGEQPAKEFMLKNSEQNLPIRS